MKQKLILFFLCAFAGMIAQNADSLQLRKIYDYYLTQSKAYENLEYLATKIGSRLSGSPGAAKAVEWAKKAMYEAGADTVILQPCMVPHWVRGAKEKCILSSSKLKLNKNLNCCALGNCVGTGSKGVKAKVIEVKSFDDLEKLGEKEIKGKIVFYNVFFNQCHVRTGSAYGECVKFRGQGASQAAKYGAVGTIVRSMTSVADDEPHTGNMNYDTSVCKTKIVTLAVSYKAADELVSSLEKDPNLELYLETHCQTLPDEPSFNVVGQINGSLKNNEYIIAGGHLDAWDNGQGAHDDGAGVVQSMEILAMYKKMGLKPKHNIRAVAFMNEENGLRGGEAYAKFAVQNKEEHLAALETDAGGFTPRGFGIDTTKGLYNLAIKWKNLFTPYYVDKFSPGGGGADISPLDKLGVPCIGFEPDTQRYFDIHHTAADTFDKINKRELNLGAGGIGALIYLIDKYYP
ncbi:MAG: M20/M25/M40 family metallo-hydrolase [Sphingobacteriaceae bacterium]|nr:M20/M25/M40 family metallo-hydrolase [Sphingobacteriaceae bacterium]